MQQFKDINFSALAGNHVPKVLFRGVNEQIIKLPQPLSIIVALMYMLLLMGVFIAGGFIIFVVLGLIVSLTFSVHPLLGFAVLAVAAWALVGVSKKGAVRHAKYQTAMRSFAADNGWEYGTIKEVGRLPQGFIWNMAARKSVELVSIQGVLVDHRFELIVGYQTHTQSRHTNFMPPTLVIEAQSQLPRALLLSRNFTDGSKWNALMQVRYQDMQKVSLEGDFDNYFQLYIPHDAQVPALSLIAPDFMETAKLYSQKFTIEISDKYIALTRPEEFSQELYQEVFMAAEKLIAELI